MEKLKNIVYLDYEKIYSLSSQLFEGILIQSSEQHDVSFQEIEAVMDGKSVERSNQELEKKRLQTFLNPHDYHYLKFEKALIEAKRLFNVCPDSPLHEIQDKSFIKITGRIILTDYGKLRYTTSNFTDIAYALQYVSNNGRMNDLDERISQANSNAKQKLKKEKDDLIRILKRDASLDQKDYFDKISYIMNYAYGDDVEITQSIGKHSITSFFIKEFFKMPLDMFVRRYSRKSAVDFTIIGLVTQYSRAQPEEVDDSSDDEPEFRKAIINLTHSTFDVESTFSAPFENEVFVEPIAMYTEV